jgi:hypothetical protein
MTIDEPQFTLGIEEEYLLVDQETRSLVVDPPKSLLSECKELLGNQVTNELLRSQIEIGTKVCNNIQEAREDLAKSRKHVIEVTGRHGIAPIACSTHPFSRWSEQELNGCVEHAIGAILRLLVTSITCLRNFERSSRASRMLLHTFVPISICERKSSLVT